MELRFACSLRADDVVDLTREKRLDMDEAAAFAGVTRQTIYAWFTRRHGKRLETAKMGGKRITTLEALQRFLDQDGDEQAAASVPAGPQPDHDRAMQLLRERHGF